MYLLKNTFHALQLALFFMEKVQKKWYIAVVSESFLFSLLLPLL